MTLIYLFRYHAIHCTFSAAVITLYTVLQSLIVVLLSFMIDSTLTRKPEATPNLIFSRIVLCPCIYILFLIFPVAGLCMGIVEEWGLKNHTANRK